MFESISFSRASLVDLTSLGELAECLLYYKKVHVIVDHGSFTGLARVCGPEALLGLIEDDHLAVTYLENRPVIATQLVAGREQHGFALMQAKGKESQSLVPQLFQELTGKQGRGRRLAQRFLDRLSTKTYVAGDLSRSLGAIKDITYTDRLVPQILAARGVSGLPTAPRFRVHEENAAFLIDTNLDFAMLNAEYRRINLDHNLEPALALDLLYEGYAEVDLAASLAAELAPTSTESVIAKERIASVPEASGRSLDRLSAFRSFVVPHNGSIAEAINGRTRTFEELRALLAKADRFKQWVNEQAPDGDLARAYIDQVTSTSWRTGSTTKTLRFILFNAAQIAAGAAIAGPGGVVAGVALAATDSYLLDRLLTGWRPHQFVRGPLEKFLTGTPLPNDCCLSKAST
jgi:hypothetical protein